MHSITLDGVRWAYTEDGTGRLVLFFHGTLSSHALWETQIAALRDRYRCLAFDWPGHGGSGFDPDGWTVDDLVEAVPRLLDALDAERAVLAGFSQGAAISLRVALRYPERVAALVSMSTAPDPLPSDASARLARLGQTLATGDDVERRAALVHQQRGVYHAPGWVDAYPDAAERELQIMLGHERAAMPLVTRIPSLYESIETELGAIRCPTLIVWGEHDARASRGPAMAAAISGSTLCTIAGAGHHVTLDASEATTATLAAFLDALPEG